MPYDYDRVTGPIDPETDSKAVQMHKAGVGAFVSALAHGGWSEEQIVNGLRTLFDSTSAVLAEYVGDLMRGEPNSGYAAGLYAAEVALTPLPIADHCQCFWCLKCPCRPDYCNACVPEPVQP